MHQPYTTNTLSHFIGRESPKDHEANYRRLRDVLKSGRVSHKPHTDAGEATGYYIDVSKDLHTEELIVPTVTCFADIPEESLSIHVEKYGCFGLGFERLFVIKAGARPVTYVPMVADAWRHALNGQDLLQDIQATYLGFRNHYNLCVKEGSHSRTLKEIPKTESQVLRSLKSLIEKDFLAYVKPFSAELSSDDPANYYMEREWRKYGYLRFSFSDVKRVWLAHGYADKIADEFPGLDISVLKELHI